MDYFELLHKAQTNKNKSVTSKDTRCYKATFTPPKKSEKSRVSSDNIKKFLARKEEEEKKKLLEAKRKKEELLALRSMDKKAHKRVQTMLKRTKSANKSVMEDAIDNFNTKDTLEGPKQCDEDDYGYVSQEASAFYEKLMAKYETGPVENLKQMSREVKDLKAAKDRVKAALDREAEEQLHPTRKRKRKHDDGDSSLNEDGKDVEPEEVVDKRKEKYIRDAEKEDIKEKPKKIPKKSAPPPVDFLELMKIAAKKQHEPILIEKKVEKPEERPMTLKEKLEHRKLTERPIKKSKPPDKSSSCRDEMLGKSQLKSSIKPSSDKSEPPKQKPVLKDKGDTSNQASSTPVLHFKKKEVKFGPSSDKSPMTIPKTNSNGFKDKNGNVSDSNSKPLNNISSKSSLPSFKVKADKIVEKPKVDVSDIDKEIEMLMKKKKMLMEAAKSKANQKPCLPSQSSRDNIQKSSQDGGTNKISGVKSSGNMPVKKVMNDSKNDIPAKGASMLRGILSDRDKLQSKFSGDKDKLTPKVMSDKDKLPPKGMKPGLKPSPGERKFSPPRYLPQSKPPPSQMKKKPNKRVIDSESEYDSEMDDFIDDGPEDCMDYSRHIKEIFGYDKSRYSNVDEGECEEASFRTQMIEERRSARIGLMEDLEDIQREKEEKARAKMKKKMIGKR